MSDGVQAGRLGQRHQESLQTHTFVRNLLKLILFTRLLFVIFLPTHIIFHTVSPSQGGILPIKKSELH